MLGECEELSCLGCLSSLGEAERMDCSDVWTNLLRLAQMAFVKVIQLKATSPKFNKFRKSEWERVHREHYGVALDWDYWKIRHLYLEALERKEVVGILTGELEGGVLYIPELIVKHDKLGQGIGENLLREAEKWTRDQGGHEVYLTTGIRWKAVDFYKKLGYEIAGQLPRHYSKVDFILLRKFV